MTLLLLLLLLVTSALAICLPDPPFYGQEGGYQGIYQNNPELYQILSGGIDPYSFTQNMGMQQGGFNYLSYPGTNTGMQQGGFNYLSYPGTMLGMTPMGIGTGRTGMGIQQGIFPNYPMYSGAKQSDQLGINSKQSNIWDRYGKPLLSHDEQQNIETLFRKPGEFGAMQTMDRTYPLPPYNPATSGGNCHPYAPVFANNMYGGGHSLYDGAWQHIYAPQHLEYLKELYGYDFLNNQYAGNMQMQGLGRQDLESMQMMYGPEKWRKLLEIYSPQYIMYLQTLYGPEFIKNLRFNDQFNGIRMQNNFAQNGGRFWQTAFRPLYDLNGINQHIFGYLNNLGFRNPYMYNPYPWRPYPWFHQWNYGPPFGLLNYLHQQHHHPIPQPTNPVVLDRFQGGTEKGKDKEKDVIKDNEKEKPAQIDGEDVGGEVEEGEEGQDQNIEFSGRFDAPDDKGNAGKDVITGGKKDNAINADKGEKPPVIAIEKVIKADVDKNNVAQPEKVTGGTLTVTAAEGGNKDVKGKEYVSTVLKDAAQIDGTHTDGGDITSRSSYGEKGVVTKTIETVQNPKHISLTINIPTQTISKKVEITQPAEYQASEETFSESEGSKGGKGRLRSGLWHGSLKHGHGTARHKVTTVNKSGHGHGTVKIGMSGEGGLTGGDDGLEYDVHGGSGHGHGGKYKISGHGGSVGGDVLGYGVDGHGSSGDEHGLKLKVSEHGGSVGEGGGYELGEEGGSAGGHGVLKYKVTHHGGSKHGLGHGIIKVSGHEGLADGQGVSGDGDKLGYEMDEEGGSGGGHGIVKYKVTHHGGSKHGLGHGILKISGHEGSADRQGTIGFGEGGNSGMGISKYGGLGFLHGIGLEGSADGQGKIAFGEGGHEGMGLSKYGGLGFLHGIGHESSADGQGKIAFGEGGNGGMGLSKYGGLGFLHGIGHEGSADGQGKIAFGEGGHGGMGLSKYGGLGFLHGIGHSGNLYGGSGHGHGLWHKYFLKGHGSGTSGHGLVRHRHNSTLSGSAGIDTPEDFELTGDDGMNYESTMELEGTPGYRYQIGGLKEGSNSSGGGLELGEAIGNFINGSSKQEGLGVLHGYGHSGHFHGGSGHGHGHGLWHKYFSNGHGNGSTKHVHGKPGKGYNITVAGSGGSENGTSGEFEFTDGDGIDYEKTVEFEETPGYEYSVSQIGSSNEGGASSGDGSKAVLGSGYVSTTGGNSNQGGSLGYRFSTGGGSKEEFNSSTDGDSKKGGGGKFGYVEKEAIIPGVHTITVDIPVGAFTSTRSRGVISEKLPGGMTVNIKEDTGPKIEKVIKVSDVPFISHPRNDIDKDTTKIEEKEKIPVQVEKINGVINKPPDKTADKVIGTGVTESDEKKHNSIVFPDQLAAGAKKIEPSTKV